MKRDCRSTFRRRVSRSRDPIWDACSVKQTAASKNCSTQLTVLLLASEGAPLARAMCFSNDRSNWPCEGNPKQDAEWRSFVCHALRQSDGRVVSQKTGTKQRGSPVDHGQSTLRSAPLPYNKQRVLLLGKSRAERISHALALHIAGNVHDIGPPPSKKHYKEPEHKKQKFLNGKDAR